jgi:hypothetical protein
MWIAIGAWNRLAAAHESVQRYLRGAFALLADRGRPLADSIARCATPIDEARLVHIAVSRVLGYSRRADTLTTLNGWTEGIEPSRLGSCKGPAALTCRPV